MKKTVKRAGGLLLGGASLLTVLSACASPAEPTPAPTLPAATATTVSVATAPTLTTAPAPTATASTAPTSTASAAATSPANPGNAPSNEQLAQGKLIFEKTAGGVGCAYCHGMEAKGNGPANVSAPDIRSKTEQDIRDAVGGGVPMMSIVKLTEAEYEAVAAYLATLDK